MHFLCLLSFFFFFFVFFFFFLLFSVMFRSEILLCCSISCLSHDMLPQSGGFNEYPQSTIIYCRAIMRENQVKPLYVKEVGAIASF